MIIINVSAILSKQLAFFEGLGDCIIEVISNDRVERSIFNNKFELDNETFEEPSPHFFNFNNSLGACPTCQGTGMTKGIDRDKVIEDP